MGHGILVTKVIGGVLAVALAGGTAGIGATHDHSRTAPAAHSATARVTIYLTRHGNTWLNELGLAQGWSDSPLTSEGEANATDDGLGFAADHIRFSAVYSGDMVRHYETASLIVKAMHSSLQPQRSEELREMAFGKFEGAPNDTMWNAIAQADGYPNEAALFAAMGSIGMMNALDGVAKANAGSDLTAETPQEVQSRMVSELTDIAKTQQKRGGGNVLVVSSGISILCALSAFTSDLSAASSGISNGAVSVLTYQRGTWTVKSVNDTGYLQKGAAIAAH